MNRFAVMRPVPPARSNAEIARDFLDLSFALESGRALPVLTRFEGPVTLRVTGRPVPTLEPDLNRVLGRLRREAGIPITQVAAGQAANVTIEAVSRADIRNTLPSAACFVVPSVGSLREYRRTRGAGLPGWSDLSVRRKVAIFVPADASPQELRDCLNEELAQALGPLDDLYRLPDSVYNDDNVHAVLTGFDMLVLRAYYAPDLHSGMTRQQVAHRLPRLLARLNPAGETIEPHFLPATPRVWINAMQTALGPGTPHAERSRAARRALHIAQVQGWRDHRLAFSHFALGRMLQPDDPKAARAQFEQADAIYRTHPGLELHRAFTASQLAGYALSDNDAAGTLRLVRPAIPVARQYRNAALLASLLMLKADALAMEGQDDAARSARLDSLGWARYGYGADWSPRTHTRRVAGLEAGPGSP